MSYGLFLVWRKNNQKKEDIEKQYPYVMQLQLEHVEHKKHQKN